jgi:hypothetical protein
MSDDPKQNWTDEEAAALRSLRDDAGPPPAVEERIVSALKQRGRIRAQGGTIAMMTRTMGAVAAATILFAGGYLFGQRAAAKPTPEQPDVSVAQTGSAAGEQEFMLLMFMRGHDPSADAPPADDAAYRAIIDEYRQWAIDRENEGRLVSAEKLASTTRVMTKAAGEISVTGDTGSDRVLGGYFLITAPSLDDALGMARTHPHLKYGGEVEVRPIEKTRG